MIKVMIKYMEYFNAKHLRFLKMHMLPKNVESVKFIDIFLGEREKLISL